MCFITKRCNFISDQDKQFKKEHCVVEFDQSKWLKRYTEFNSQEITEAEKNGGKFGKAFC